MLAITPLNSASSKVEPSWSEWPNTRAESTIRTELIWKNWFGTGRENNGSMMDIFPAQQIWPDGRTLWNWKCDILIPAALENQITGANAANIKAKIIGEGANGPVTSDAEDILESKGIMVVPDLYINAGGVTVSYFEWLKNLSHVRFGRMEKRFEQNTFDRIMKLIEQETGRTLTDEEKSMVARGADEADLVYSGLEETMITAYNQIREGMKANPGISEFANRRFQKRD